MRRTLLIVAIPYALGSLLAIGIGAVAMSSAPLIGLILVGLGVREIVNLARLWPRGPEDDGWRPDGDDGPDAPADSPPGAPTGKRVYRAPGMDAAGRWRRARSRRRQPA